MAGVGAGLAGAVTSTGLKVGFGVLEKSVAAAYGVVSKTAGAVGGLAKGMARASDAMKSAAQVKNKNPESPIVIISNTGMVGRAGKQKVTGSGTLPPLKSTASPRVSEKMPTEALLDTAVKYLSGIDKTLKAQLEFERRSFEQQVRDEREAQIESKSTSSFSFSDIKNRLSGFKSTTQATGSDLLAAAKWAAGIGATASLIASALNPKELEDLKKNIEAFKDKFSWLNEIPAGGLAGFIFGLLTGKGLKGRLLGGLKGGIIGIATGALANVILNKTTGTEISEDTKSVLNMVAAGGIGYLGYRGIKSGVGAYGNMKAAGAKMADLKANSTIYDPKSARIKNVTTGAYAATNTAAGFLKSPRWQKFLNWLTKRGERTLVNKIQQRIAIAVTTGAITASGIGAVFGAIGFLANLGFSLYFMYQIYELWKEFTSNEEADKAGVGNTDLEKELKGPDAARTGADGVSSQSPKSFTPSTTGQNKTITGVVDGGAGYTTVTYSDGTTERRTGTLPARTNNPGNIMYGPIAKSYGAVGSSPSTNGPPVAVFPTPTHGFAAMDGLLSSKYSGGPIGQTIEKWATDPTHPAKVLGTSGVDPNKKYTDFTHDEKVRFMQALAKVEGYYATGSGPSVSSAPGGIGSALASATTSSLEATGKLFGALGGAIIKPGVPRQFVPSSGNVSERINNDSMKIQNDITFGIKNKESKDTIISPSIPGTPSTGGPGPVKTISSIDPNYSNMDIIKHYVAHFRMAA